MPLSAQDQSPSGRKKACREGKLKWLSMNGWRGELSDVLNRTMKIRSHISPAVFCMAFLHLLVTQRCYASSDLAGYEPKSGDIVFQSLAHSPLTDMIEGVTQSTYSHCGIVAEEKGKWKVIEAIGPVREIPLTQWIQQGRGGAFAAYRLKPPCVTDTGAFIRAAKDYMGRPYDIHYEMDDAKIYCSELVFKAFRNAAHEDLGHLVKLRELNWQPYVHLIEEIEGGSVPLDREIITPKDIANASQLQCVYSRDISPTNSG
jgi:hypothetical protein